MPPKWQLLGISFVLPVLNVGNSYFWNVVEHCHKFLSSRAHQGLAETGLAPKWPSVAGAV